MRYLSIREILELHEIIIKTSGGALGIRDIRALESSISHPRLTFNQVDLYPDVITKAAALCFFLVMSQMGLKSGPLVMSVEPLKSYLFPAPFSLGPISDDGLHNIQVIGRAAFDMTIASFLFRNASPHCN